MVIDAHAHVFPRVHGLTSSGITQGIGFGRVKIGSETERVVPPYNSQTIFTPEMLIANLDWAGVDRAVLLQGPFYGECNAYVLEAINHYPDRLSGLAYLDPWDYNARPMLDWILNTAAFKGIKLECSAATGLIGIHPGAKLNTPENAWLWQTLEDCKMILVLDLGRPGSNSYQTVDVRAIAERHPGLKIVIAHLGQPGPWIEALTELRQTWQEQIELGRLPNIWFDCAALPAYLPDETFPYPTAGMYLRMVIERIGPRKVMWGSDQPGLLVHLDLPHLVKMMKQHLAFLPSPEQALVLGDNAMELFNLTKRGNNG